MFDISPPNDTHVVLYHEHGFWAIPPKQLPEMVRRMMDMERARYNLRPTDDVHWQMALKALGTGVGLEMFAQNLARQLAEARMGRISDVMREAMQRRGDEQDAAVTQSPPDGDDSSTAAQPKKQYDPDALWQAIEDICKGGG